MDTRISLWVILSLFIHALVLLPYLGGYLEGRPSGLLHSGPVAVHFSATTSTEPKGGGYQPPLPDTNQHKIHKERPQPKPTKALAHVPKKPKPQEMPRTDNDPYPQAPQAIRNPEVTKPSLNPGPPGPPVQQATPGDGVAKSDGGGKNEQQHLLVRPKPNLPDHVPLPDALQDKGLNNYPIVISVDVALDGRAKASVMSSGGNAEFDRFVIGLLERYPWTPGTVDGQPQQLEVRFRFEASFERGGELNLGSLLNRGFGQPQ